jgi:hypothetical protein
LIAHGALYGRDHSMGGNYHAFLIETAVAGLVVLLYASALLAWSGARTALTGSVLAARVAGRLPGFAALFASTLLWYAAAESVEPHHADASLLVAGLCLAAAAWIVTLLGRCVCALLAEAILAIFGAAFAPRIPAWYPSRYPLRPLRRMARSRRRFARPPPIGVVCRA